MQGCGLTTRIKATFDFDLIHVNCLSHSNYIIFNL